MRSTVHFAAATLLVWATSATAGDPILLSRKQADGMTTARLAALLLADFPHGHIRSHRMDSLAPDVHGSTPDPSLGWIAFFEEGQVDGAAFCRAREIIVTFDNLDGGTGKPLAERTTTDFKRRFHVGARTLLAVPERHAQSGQCRGLPRAAYAQIGSAAAEAALRRLFALSVAARRGEAPTMPATCEDSVAQPDSRCDPVAVLAVLEWPKLFSAWSTDFSGEPVTTHISFSDEPYIWSAVLAGAEGADSLRLRRGYPAPF